MNDRNDRRGNNHGQQSQQGQRNDSGQRFSEQRGRAKSKGSNEQSRGGYPARLESPAFGRDRFGVRPASDYGYSGDDRFGGRELRVSGDGFPIAGDFRAGHDPADHEHMSGWGGSVRDDHDLSASGRYENRWGTRPDPRFVPEHGFAGPYVGRGPKGYVRSDERIREEICEMLYLQGYVDTAEVEVSVQNGEVTFTGTVQNRGDKRFIEEMAERVAGVNEIHNQIRRSRAPGERDSSVDLSSQSSGRGHAQNNAAPNGNGNQRTNEPPRTSARHLSA